MDLTSASPCTSHKIVEYQRLTRLGLMQRSGGLIHGCVPGSPNPWKTMYLILITDYCWILNPQTLLSLSIEFIPYVLAVAGRYRLVFYIVITINCVLAECLLLLLLFCSLLAIDQQEWCQYHYSRCSVVPCDWLIGRNDNSIVVRGLMLFRYKK